MNKLFSEENFNKLLGFTAITLIREMNKEELIKSEYDHITSRIDDEVQKVFILFMKGREAVFIYTLTFEQISMMAGLKI